MPWQYIVTVGRLSLLPLARRFVVIQGYPSKCFTCVTKTIANLATYSRKLENYNGAIIFEFNIMKNSSPINSNLCQT